MLFQNNLVYSEESHHPCLVDSMNKELQTLKANHTWSIIYKPIGFSLIGCKWVYKVKRKAVNILESYRAHLVTKRYTQTKGIDILGQTLTYCKDNNCRGDHCFNCYEGLTHSLISIINLWITMAMLSSYISRNHLF
jgi:hypothetical protein